MNEDQQSHPSRKSLRIVLIGLTLFTEACGAVPDWVFTDSGDLPPVSRPATPAEKSPDTDEGGDPGPQTTVSADFYHWDFERLPVSVYFDRNFSASDLDAIQLAADVWEEAIGHPVLILEGVDDRVDYAQMQGIFSTLGDEVNSFLIHPDWDLTGKGPGVIASTVWRSAHGSREISQADIIYNYNHFNFSGQNDGQQRLPVDMFTISLHEIGHFLGMGHQSEDVDPDSIMLPTIDVSGDGVAVRSLSAIDIANIQTMYRCTQRSCDSIEAILDRIQALLD